MQPSHLASDRASDLLRQIEQNIQDETITNGETWLSQLDPTDWAYTMGLDGDLRSVQITLDLGVPISVTFIGDGAPAIRAPGPESTVRWVSTPRLENAVWNWTVEIYTETCHALISGGR